MLAKENSYLREKLRRLGGQPSEEADDVATVDASHDAPQAQARAHTQVHAGPVAALLPAHAHTQDTALVYEEEEFGNTIDAKSLEDDDDA